MPFLKDTCWTRSVLLQLWNPTTFLGPDKASDSDSDTSGTCSFLLVLLGKQNMTKENTSYSRGHASNSDVYCHLKGYQLRNQCHHIRKVLQVE